MEFPAEIGVSEETILLMKKMIEKDDKMRINFKELKEVMIKEHQ